MLRSGPHLIYSESWSSLVVFSFIVQVYEIVNSDRPEPWATRFWYSSMFFNYLLCDFIHQYKLNSSASFSKLPDAEQNCSVYIV